MTGETITEAVRVLREGGVIIYPTETCYGLGADATNVSAIRRIYSIKNRSLDKPLSVIVSSISMIKEFAVISRDTEALINEFMPGPLTLVVKNKSFPQSLCGGGVTVGFRIPDHVVALELVKAFGKPIISTSANVSGGEDQYVVPEGLPVDFVINYGKLPFNKPSTVYDTIHKRVVREGPVKL